MSIGRNGNNGNPQFLVQPVEMRFASNGRELFAFVWLDVLAAENSLGGSPQGWHAKIYPPDTKITDIFPETAACLNWRKLNGVPFDTHTGMLASLARKAGA